MNRVLCIFIFFLTANAEASSCGQYFADVLRLFASPDFAVGSGQFKVGRRIVGVRPNSNESLQARAKKLEDSGRTLPNGGAVERVRRLQDIYAEVQSGRGSHKPADVLSHLREIEFSEAVVKAANYVELNAESDRGHAHADFTVNNSVVVELKTTSSATAHSLRIESKYDGAFVYYEPFRPGLVKTARERWSYALSSLSDFVHRIAYQTFSTRVGLKMRRGIPAEESTGFGIIQIEMENPTPNLNHVTFAKELQTDLNLALKDIFLQQPSTRKISGLIFEVIFTDRVFFFTFVQERTDGKNALRIAQRPLTNRES